MHLQVKLKLTKTANSQEPKNSVKLCFSLLQKEEILLYPQVNANGLNDGFLSGPVNKAVPYAMQGGGDVRKHAGQRNMKKEVNKMTTEQIKVLADKLRMIPGFTRNNFRSCRVKLMEKGLFMDYSRTNQEKGTQERMNGMDHT
ncbi:hypothetical protein H671_2g5892 [Cricetulus griseus]|uniref:Uncharacterized protein n=1 Tax=Cricetulus griseus TaxID=10029 RepID=A0A061II84_CRIGR|nr:hypothetical protein H671_2g5892 [Cricetulus griseus]